MNEVKQHPGVPLHGAAHIAEEHHGPGFFRRLWGELLTLEVLGAARRDTRGWRLTESGRYWLMLMMAEFFQSVNTYRDAMRAQVAAEQTAVERTAQTHANQIHRIRINP